MASEIVIAGRYKLGKKIGSGSFGEVHLGTCIDTKSEVAIKLEKTNTKFPQVLYEFKVIQRLGSGLGVPKLHWSGSEGEFNIMVMELLGPSLEDLFNFCERKFSLKTTLMVADQMLSRIEYVHANSFIHRDIKADNFLIGCGSKSAIIYIIDFGLAKRYRDPTTSQHVTYRSNKSLTGTARYASVNTHMGIEQSRRDDLESMIYVLLYFFKGKLPWQGLLAKDKGDKYKRIMQMKIATSTESLCSGCPAAFLNVLTHVKSLKFEDGPNYPYIKKQFMGLLEAESLSYDLNFDWTTKTLRKEDVELVGHNNIEQHSLKIKECNKENEEQKEVKPLNILKTLQGNESIEVNPTGKSKASRENQDPAGLSTTVDKPPAPALPIKIPTQEASEEKPKNPEEDRGTKKCGCLIF